MKNELKSEILAFLDKGGCCKFSLTLYHKGQEFGLEYQGDENEKCGDIFNKLEEWISDGDFFNYLLDHGSVYNFEGLICTDDSDKENLKISVAFGGTYEDYEESVFIYLNEEFFINELGLNLEEIGIDNFDEEYLSLIFVIEKGILKGKVSLIYTEYETININLNKKQQSILNKYILEFAVNNAPFIGVDFECLQIIDAECEENEIIYNVSTSYIKLNWNDIYTK
jgi:hypothetical protein